MLQLAPEGLGRSTYSSFVAASLSVSPSSTGTGSSGDTDIQGSAGGGDTHASGVIGREGQGRG